VTVPRIYPQLCRSLKSNEIRDTHLRDASAGENAETRARARAMTANEFLQTRGIAKEIERDLAMRRIAIYSVKVNLKR